MTEYAPTTQVAPDATLKPEDVIEVLRQCFDPEIPVNIVDLGLIYDIAIKPERVDIKMTLTALGCPLRRGLDSPEDNQHDQKQYRSTKIPSVVHSVSCPGALLNPFGSPALPAVEHQSHSTRRHHDRAWLCERHSPDAHGTSPLYQMRCAFKYTGSALELLSSCTLPDAVSSTNT